MARVKNPLLSTEVHGEVAGIEFRTSTYGNIVGRPSVTPHGRTVRQLEHQRLFTEAGHTWGIAPANTRRAWNEFATPPIDGRTAFIRAYIRLNRWGYFPDDNPQQQPEIDPISNVQLFAAVSSGPFLYITWDSPLALDNLLNIYAVTTHSHRETYTHNRLPFSAFAYSYEGASYLPVSAVGPVAYIHIENVNKFNGLVNASNDLRAEPVWL